MDKNNVGGIYGEELKFINLYTTKFDEADQQIHQYEYNKTMEKLYEDLGYNWREIDERKAQNQEWQKYIGKIKEGHHFVPYTETILNTESPKTKKITIQTHSILTEPKLFLFTKNLTDLYTKHNKDVLDNKDSKGPFLIRDGIVDQTNEKVLMTLTKASKF